MFDFLLVLLLGVFLLWLVAAVYLSGENLAQFDHASGERFSSGTQPGAELQAVVAMLAGMRTTLQGVALKEYVGVLRHTIDHAFADRCLDARFIPVDCAGVPSEWVLAPGADARRRTLYIHGGGFFAGSPASHRTLTTRFSELTGGAVLAIDYRMIPEYPRMASVEDCRTAYRWMLEHGPDGPQPAQVVFVAGDSAGGNLTLSLIAWVRDQGLRRPDAAVVLSPITDSTFAGPSLRTNARSDVMLGAVFGRLLVVPRFVLLWATWIHGRINPRHPLVSPVYGDLSNLPPVLVQASQVEMLVDDCRRYVNRARAAGSPVKLQTWNHMVHVWQIFNPELPEARQALAEIGKFLAAASPPPAKAFAGEPAAGAQREALARP